MGLFEFFNKKNAADVSTLFTDENKVSISATDAYKKSRYGILKSDKMLLEEFFTDVKLMVEQKNMERSYCGMLQLDDDIIKFLPRIKDRLMRQLGFKVIILDACTWLMVVMKSTNKLTISVYLVAIKFNNLSYIKALFYFCKNIIIHISTLIRCISFFFPCNILLLMMYHTFYP